MSRSLFGHVVVLGGSVAGLLTAHVLTRYARQVSVVERDEYPDGPLPRAGVPQSRHTHVLLTSGIDALRALLPGLFPAILDAGAPCLAIPGEVGVWQANQWVSRRNPSRPVLTPTRPFLEQSIRDIVLAGPHIGVLPATEVTGLIGGSRRISGVVVRGRHGVHSAERELAADLVVDATGRSSRTPEWLAQLGAPAPHEEVLDTGRGYATGVFTADSASAGDLRGFYIVPDARQPLGTIILPAEGDRWMVTLSGPKGQAPPTDPDGFVEFARGLPHDAPYQWLSAATPVGRMVGYRHTANRRRRYDRTARDLDGLLVIGDAATALNPVYGQGLSVAASSALALDRLLAGIDDLPSSFGMQRAVLRASSWAWDVATGADRPMPGATGNALHNGPLNRALDWYLRKVIEHVPGDPVVCQAFRDVLFLLAPPSSLLTKTDVVRRALLRPAVSTPPDLPSGNRVDPTVRLTA